MDDGIYFGLPEADYHALPRLSASGIKTLTNSPLQFWLQSWMNPEREPDTDTPAKKLGRAYHKLILEGDEAFDAAYAVKPSPEDYPDALAGAAALKDRCGDLGLKRTGTIAEMCARIREADPAVQLWPDIEAAASEDSAHRETLTRAQWSEIQRVRFVLSHMPSIKAAFTDGYPEVSCLWTCPRTGVQMKCRIDYLKPRGEGLAGILDLKSFGNVMDKAITAAPVTEITRNRYHIQPPCYFDGWAAMQAMWQRDGMAMVHGDAPPEEWLSAVLTAKRPTFHFVFVRTGGVPDIIAREFAEFDTHYGMTLHPSEVFRCARSQYRAGQVLFAKFMDQNGPGTPWITDYGVQALTDFDFPPWFVDQISTPGIQEAAE